MNAPARRGLLAAVGGVALAAPRCASPGPAMALSATPNADASLVAWCARFARAEDDYEEAIAPHPDGKFPPDVESVTDALWDEECDLLARINATPATTEAGRAAKARVYLRIARDAGDDTERAVAVREALMRDLLAADHGWLAEHDGIVASREAAAWAARAGDAARRAAAPPPDPWRDDRTPEQQLDGARQMVRFALRHLRDVQADLQAVAS